MWYIFLFFILAKHMQIKIQSTDWIIRQWESDKITLPTAMWETTILANHAEMISVISNGMIKIKSDSIDPKYTYEGGNLLLSVIEWIVYVSDNYINVMSGYVSMSASENSENLSVMKAKLQSELSQINHDIDSDEYMNILNQIEKINAEIRFHKFTN